MIKADRTEYLNLLLDHPVIFLQSPTLMVFTCTSCVSLPRNLLLIYHLLRNTYVGVCFVDGWPLNRPLYLAGASLGRRD